MTRSHTAKRWLIGLSITLGSTALVACSSGGEDGGRTAGIEGTGIVSGFGSVYVDGIEFQTDGAEILFNGDPSDENALRVGDVITIKGTVDDNGTARAQRIVFDRTLEGPIQQISVDDDGRGSLVALGQTVDFGADTTFINTPAEELVAGDLIAISGFVATDGKVDASSIQQGPTFRPDGTRLDAEGTARNVTPTGFTIEGLTVNYGSATVDDAAGALADGAFVEVFGTRSAPDDAPLIADRVNVIAPNRAENGNRMFVEAQIRDFDTLADFTAAGWRIDASNAERIDETGIAPGANVRVSVRGTERNGIVHADTLAIEPEANTTFEATVGAVDTQADTLTVLGSTLAVPSDTRYLDSRTTAADDRRLRLNTLAAGEAVRVRGYESTMGFATHRIERIDAGTGALARGHLDSVTRSGSSATLVIAGSTVRTADDQTEYRDTDGSPIEASTFFARADSGVRVEARGPENADEINTATSVQLLD